MTFLKTCKVEWLEGTIKDCLKVSESKHIHNINLCIIILQYNTQGLFVVLFVVRCSLWRAIYKLEDS